MNQIFTIRPYLWNGTWVFDDPAVGLVREALVSGMPEMIARATERAGIARPENGFVALFSKDPFPGADVVLRWVREESGGNTYEWEGQEGWLCPALFRYFDEAPPTLYVQVRPAEVAPDFDAWFQRQSAGLLDRLPLTLPECVADDALAWLRAFAEDAWQAGRRSAAT
jgi:hypothetical protein